jgi:superfamily I DNA/RNA helicase
MAEWMTTRASVDRIRQQGNTTNAQHHHYHPKTLADSASWVPSCLSSWVPCLIVEEMLKDRRVGFFRLYAQEPCNQVLDQEDQIFQCTTLGVRVPSDQAYDVVLVDESQDLNRVHASVRPW